MVHQQIWKGTIRNGVIATGACPNATKSEEAPTMGIEYCSYNSSNYFHVEPVTS